MRLAIELAERDAWLYANAARCWIDVNALHPRQIDHQAAVAQRAPAHIVSAAAYGDEQPVLTREANRGNHIRQAGAAGDQPGALVDAGIPYASGGVVVGITMP